MNIQEFLQNCKKQHIIIIGDLMVDRYLWGNVSRISPEAPVPIVEIINEENRLGGAANVGLNIAALGAKPLLCGVYGEDKDGEILHTLFEKHQFAQDLLFSSTQRRTTVKVRVIGGQQHMLRVDKEDRFELSMNEKEKVLKKIANYIPQCQALIFQDYDKGFLDKFLIEQITRLANAAKVPIIVDPKFKHFFDFHHCTLFKPNLKELNEGLNLRLHKNDIEGICRAAGSLRKQMPHQLSLITLSENGVLLVDEKFKGHHIPAHYRTITDVSGAGDTVVSVMGLGLACGLSPVQAATYANLAGGLVCEEVGVVPIWPERLLRE